MGLLCLLMGHSPGCQCSRCGKSADELHHWDGCKCTNCGKIMHNWLIRDWSFDGFNYTFEQACTKCKEKRTLTEPVPFGKIVLGRQVTI